MSIKSMSVTDVTGCTHITVTRAHARARKSITEQPVTSVTSVTSAATVGSMDEGLATNADCLLDTVLVLDLGTSPGWALRSADGMIVSGTVNFQQDGCDGDGMRYLRFTNWLTELDQQSGPIAAIWFEDSRCHAGVDTVRDYGGLMATLTAWAELRGIPYKAIPTGTIKRFATGKANASKEAVTAAIRARGFHPANGYEANALALLLWAIETIGGVR